MTESSIISIVTTGFAVAFLHAAIPTHWLPFVVTARAQGWRLARTLGVTAIAGIGHILLTIVLGVAVVWLGIEINDRYTKLFPWVAGSALILLGAFYLWRQVSRRGHAHIFGHRHSAEHAHGHNHPHVHGHHHAHDDEHDHAHAAHSNAPSRHSMASTAIAEARTIEGAKARRSDWAAVAGLLALLTFSPCEGFLPVYLSGARLGWWGFLLLSAILAAATLAGMMIFTGLASIGFNRLKIAALERLEGFIIGSLLVILGFIVIVFD